MRWKNAMSLDATLTPDLILILVAMITATVVLAGAVGGGVYAFRFSPRAKLRRRVASIAHPDDAGAMEQSDKAAANPRRKLVQAKLKELEATQKKSPRRHRIRQLLKEAGIELSLRNYYILSGIAALLGAGAYLLTGFQPIGALLVAIPSGLLLPKLIIGHLGKRRKKAFTKQFADAVDVIVRGVQSGLPVNECLNIIARESPDPVGLEFRLLTESQRLGLTMEEALTRSIERLPTPEMKFFAIVLNIQQQTGGNLAETLSNLSRVLRDRKKMADKVKAMSSEAKASAGIIGSLPFVMTLLLYVTNEDYIMNLFTDPIGHMLIGAGLGLMAIGSAIMKKMVSFEI